MTVGVWTDSNAILLAATILLESEGRKTLILGMLRRFSKASNGLMGRSTFNQSNKVMGKDIHDTKLAQTPTSE